MSSKFRNLVALNGYRIILKCNIPSRLSYYQLSNICSKNSNGSEPDITTAGIIIIGDEILKGEVLEANSYHAAKLFHKLGIKVRKVSVVADVISEITDEVKLFSKSYDYVLTTGGIGPTHDDVTYDAIAKAFNVKLKPNPILVEICKKFFKVDDLNSPLMKLAFIPDTAKLTFGENKKTGEKTKYPNVSIQNVYIFPGVPQLFKKSLDILGEDLFHSRLTFYGSAIYLNVYEDTIVQELNKVVDKYPDVQFGSYPMLNNKEYKLKITIESTTQELAEKATDELVEGFSESKIVSIVASTSEPIPDK